MPGISISLTCCLSLALASVLSGRSATAAEPQRSGIQRSGILRAGILGCDTSHVVAFTKIFNDPKGAGPLADVQVTAAFPGGSDIPASRDRVAGYTEQLQKMNVEIVDSIDALLGKVDVVLLESVDGRTHLAQLRPVLAAKKPVYIDKPMAGSLADVLRIAKLVKESGVPCFSSSSLRFAPDTLKARDGALVGKVLGCSTFSPCTLEPTHPDLFWYGIHGVESLFTVMGSGCIEVSRVHSDTTDVVTGLWSDGRIGVFRGMRDGKHDYGGTVFGEKGTAPVGEFKGYDAHVIAVAEFFKTGKPPVSMDETIEIYAFMEAADESKRQHGATVRLDSVLKTAQKEADSARSSDLDLQPGPPRR